MSEESRLFTERYGPVEPLHEDSPTLRSRIGSYCHIKLFKFNADLGGYLKQEIGGHIPVYTSGQNPYITNHYNFELYTTSLSLERFLNLITKVYDFLQGKEAPAISAYANSREQRRAQALFRAMQHGGRPIPAEDPPYRGMHTEWVEFANRVFQEEKVIYEVHDDGSVRYKLDREIRRQFAEILNGLNDPALAGAAIEIRKAFSDLTSTPPQTKNAIRATFDALEIVVKHYYRVEKLNRNVVLQKIRPQLEEQFKGDAVATKTSDNAISKPFGDWVDAVHNYRHGQPDAVESRDPPLIFAVAVLSTGLTYLRLVCDINAQLP